MRFGSRSKGEVLCMVWKVQIDTGLVSLCVLLRYSYPGKDHWRVDLSSWFRPLRASHFLLLAQEKVTKEKGTPPSGPGCAGVPSFHHHSRGTTGCGPPTKGHPWPIAALATSMSLNPLRGDSTRPPEGDLGVACTIAVEEQRQRPDAANSNSAKITQARDLVPFRRPSGGVA